jgi:hypothetical protein
MRVGLLMMALAGCHRKGGGNENCDGDDIDRGLLRRWII